MTEFNLLLRSIILALYVIWMIHLILISYGSFGDNKISLQGFGAIVVKTMFSVLLVTGIVII